MKERLRAMKVREQQEKVNKTLLLTESEDLLIKSLDPVKKPPIVASSFVAINSQVLFVCFRFTFEKITSEFSENRKTVFGFFSVQYCHD